MKEVTKWFILSILSIVVVVLGLSIIIDLKEPSGIIFIIFGLLLIIISMHKLSSFKEKQLQKDEEKFYDLWGGIK